MSSESVARPEIAQPDPSTLPAAEPVGDLESDVEDARLTVASQRQLIWWRFKKHKVALASGVLLIFLYLVALLAEPIAPYDPFEVHEGRVRTRTNLSGGIQGGISNGEHILLRVAFKPTATIMREQQTVTTASVRSSEKPSRCAREISSLELC